MPRITRSMYQKDLRAAAIVGQFSAWMARRRWGLRVMQWVMVKALRGKPIEGLVNDEMDIPSVANPGRSIRVRVYKPANATGPLPAMLYIHGGGYEMGLPESAHAFIEDVIKRRNVAVIAPAYRLSLPGHPFPDGLNDCFDTLMHMKDNAADLGLRGDKFMIAGHSGGGGLTAALTLKAVDEAAADIAFQMPIYPMIDHRMETPSAQMIGCAVWDRRTNALAWQNYLGHLNGDIPDYASPGLRKDLTGMPPTISFVGDLDPFKDETIAYMEALERAGVPTKFKLYEGAFHGFEMLAPKALTSQDAIAFQSDAFAEFYDKYL